jgi:hypothetical protein
VSLRTLPSTPRNDLIAGESQLCERLDDHRREDQELVKDN